MLHGQRGRKNMRQVQRPWEAVEQMLDRALEVNILNYNLILKTCAQWEVACHLLSGMREVSLSPDVISFGTCINICAANWSHASGLLECMLANGIQANVIIYNSVMKRWSWQMSLHLLTGLPQAQLLPDILSYTSPLSALVTNRSTWHRAMNLFWGTTRSSVEADLLSFNLLLGALRDVEAMSGWQLCLSLVSGILLSRLLPNVVTYNTLLGCPKLPWFLALRLLHLMHLMGIRPDIISYNSLMATFVSESLWASALQLLCDIPQLQLQGDVITYSAAIDACGSGRQWQVGLRLLEEMHQVLIRRNAISYTSAMAAMTGCDSWTLALLLSDDMEVAAVESDILAQSQALQAMAMATAWCRCVSAVHGNHGSSAVSFRAVRAVRAVRALEAGSQWPQTLHLVRAMGMTRLALQEASVSASSASGLVGKWRHSMEVMDYLRESAEADLVSSNSVLSAAARSNAWLFSLHYLDLIQCGGSRVDEITMSAAITGCEKGHQWILALSLLGELALTLQLSVIACDAVISSCEKCGKWQEALALLAAMLSWKLIPNEITFNAAIGSCEKGQLCVTETSLRGH